VQVVADTSAEFPTQRSIGPVLPRLCEGRA
jgi:hypothetical protein